MPADTCKLSQRGIRKNSTGFIIRILNTIIKVLRARNHDIIADHFTTYAKIGDELVKFRLREKQRVSEIKDKWGGSSACFMP